MIRHILFALGIGAVLTGCMPGPGTPFGQSAPTQPPDYVFPALAQVTTDQVPDELEAVAAATARRLLGMSTGSIRRAVGVRNAGLIRPSKDLPLKGYTVREVQFLDAAASPDDADDREAVFNLLFVDGYGRDAAVRAVVGYTKARGGVRLTRADWAEQTMPAAHFDTFVVPADQTKAMLKATRSWRGLYDGAAKAALSKSSISAQMAAGGDFLIISMGKRPIGNGAKLTLELTDGPNSKNATPSEGVRQLIYPGRYVAMVLPIRIKPGGAVWGRITHTPGAEVAAAARKPLVVELFQLTGEPSG